MTIADSMNIAGTATVGRVWARIDSMYPGRHSPSEQLSCELDSLLMNELYMILTRVRRGLRHPLYRPFSSTVSLPRLARLWGFVNGHGLDARRAIQPKSVIHELSTDVLSAASSARCQLGSIIDAITGGMDAQDWDNDVPVQTVRLYPDVREALGG